MPDEPPEEMRKRIEEEKRIRLEVRRKLEAENRAVGSDRTCFGLGALHGREGGEVMAIGK